MSLLRTALRNVITCNNYSVVDNNNGCYNKRDRKPRNRRISRWKKILILTYTLTLTLICSIFCLFDRRSRFPNSTFTTVQFSISRFEKYIYTFTIGSQLVTVVCSHQLVDFVIPTLCSSTGILRHPCKFLGFLEDSLFCMKIDLLLQYVVASLSDCFFRSLYRHC